MTNAILPAQLRGITGVIVRRRWDEIAAYAARGAALGLAPSIADRHPEAVQALAR